MTKVGSLEFQLLSPSEGNSVILEVSDQTGEDFLHVEAVSESDYEFKFFVGSEELILTLSQIDRIIKASKKNIEYIDYGDEGS